MVEPLPQQQHSLNVYLVIYFMQIMKKLVFPNLSIIEFLNMLGDVTAYINTTCIAPSKDCSRNEAVESTW